MQPVVSILMPAFNAERFIADSIRSALSQTWPNREIIVMDDGSSDNTLEIAQKFEADGVQVVTQKNQGAAAARNHLFSLSKGDYIQWLDADDILAPEKIAKQMEKLERLRKPRILLSGPWGQFMYRRQQAKFTPTSLWCDLGAAEFLMRKMGQNVYMQTSSWLVSRELAEAAGPWDASLSADDDGEYFCRVLMASKGVSFVPEARVYYRVSGRSLSYIGRSQKKLDSQWRSMRLHVGYLLSLENSHRSRAACVQFLQDWLIYFYPDRRDIVEQAQQLAEELGGQLNLPRLSWKYSPIKRAFGWDLAKRAQSALPNLKQQMLRSWDKVLFDLNIP